MAEITLPHTIQLDRPFTYGSESVSTVVIEDELDAGQMADIVNEPKKGSQMIRMVAAVTGWPDPKVKMMKGRDLLRVCEAINSFLPAGPVTGN